MEQNRTNDEKQTSPESEKPMPVARVQESRSHQTVAWNRLWLAAIIAVIAAFLAGFLPMWLRSGRLSTERNSAWRETKLLQFESLAAAAAMDARRGECESARQSASQFFTMLQVGLDLGSGSSLNAPQRDALKPLLGHRDNLITLLARSDPASAERLIEVYLACRKSLRGG